MITGEIHVDHKVPVTDAKDPLFFERTNLQFLHPACHSSKTREDRKRGLTRNRT